MKIIGVDCAVSSKNIGIAIGEHFDGQVEVASVTHGAPHPGEYLAEILSQEEVALLALDAPLGWPAPLGSSLQAHTAGTTLPVEANALFRRETDRFIRKMTGKQPLEVGADRIARAALATLALLDDIRRRAGLSIPLAWHPDRLAQSSCIEVYPAATLETYGHSSRGYKGKKPEHRDARERLLKSLGGHFSVSTEMAEVMLSNDDAFDAAICLLAGADFLRGKAMRPPNLATAKKEGWIWVIDPATSTS